MKVSYNKLWKLLIDLNMSKSQLREKSGVTTNVIAKMGKNENVSTEKYCVRYVKHSTVNSMI